VGYLRTFLLRVRARAREDELGVSSQGSARLLAELPAQGTGWTLGVNSVRGEEPDLAGEDGHEVGDDRPPLVLISGCGSACAHANRRKLSVMRVGASAVLCAVALVASFASSVAAGASSPSRTLRNDRVGYSLSYPRGWKVVGQVMATGFAAEAACQSVRVVDFAPPATVPSGQILQSFVQICWKRVRDGLSLAQFMRKTYGRRLTELFRRTTFRAILAYRARDEVVGRTIFLQTSAYRLQIVAAVVARAPSREKRLAQVERTIASLSVTR
jgi:hypothetical protein